MVLSVEQLTEIGRVLSYPKIHKILKWNRREIEAYLKQLYLRSIAVDISHTTASVPKDRADNVILAALIASGAEHLITGDSDLLALRDHFPIMTPAEFVQRL